MPDHEFPVPAREVWTVSRLNREVRLLLDTGLPSLWVEGEISNLARPASGHLYFSLKDEDAQVRCVMWRSTAARLAFVPANGMHLMVRARVGVYEPRGEYQLVVDFAEEAGEGALRRRFEALKSRLQAEGLFDEAAKRPLPRLPRRIGVVTSPSGAAVRDILHVLARRFPAVPVPGSAWSPPRTPAKARGGRGAQPERESRDCLTCSWLVRAVMSDGAGAGSWSRHPANSRGRLRKRPDSIDFRRGHQAPGPRQGKIRRRAELRVEHVPIGARPADPGIAPSRGPWPSIVGVE